MEYLSPKNLNKILPVDHSGDQDTSARLLPLLYSDLQRLAQGMMAHYPTEKPYQATALVHEAYLKLGPPDDRVWNGRGHYFGAAAQAMRRILVDQTRKKKAVKHGGKMRRINLDCDTLCNPKSTIDFIDLDQALDELLLNNERKGNGVVLRYLKGLSISETAAALGISESTVVRDWLFSRTFLLAKLNEDAPGS